MTDAASLATGATVRVLLFSVLREKIGISELRAPLPDPSTGTALLEQLEKDHPEIVPFRTVLRLAVNRSYVHPDMPLKDGDEVALITPVSGG